MGKYTRVFDTEQEYNTYMSGEPYIPNMSYSREIGKGGVRLTPISPTPQHDYVEIGGIKWATMNIGATAVTDTGLYFQWGDISGYTADQVGSGTGQKYFGWADYKYGNGTSSPGATGMTKYNSTDGKTVLDLTDDGVNGYLGGQWRMPTTEEFQLLGEAVYAALTENYQGTGVAGLILFDKIDSSKQLFFPAAGYANDSLKNFGIGGYYWTSSLSNLGPTVGTSFRFINSSSVPSWVYTGNRFYGYPLRGVLDENS